MPPHPGQHHAAGGTYLPTGGANAEVRRYTQRMNLSANRGNCQDCELTISQMFNNNVRPTSVTLNVMLKAYFTAAFNQHASASISATSEHLTKAMKLLATMQNTLLHRAKFTNNHFNENDNNNTNGSMFEYIVARVKTAGVILVDEGSFNIAVSFLSKLKNFEMAKNVLIQQKQCGFRTNKGLSSLLRSLPPIKIKAIVSTYLDQGNHNLFLESDPMGIDASLLQMFDVDTTVINTLLKVMFTSNSVNNSQKGNANGGFNNHGNQDSNDHDTGFFVMLDLCGDDFSKNSNPNNNNSEFELSLAEKLLMHAKWNLDLTPDCRTFSILFSAYAAHNKVSLTMEYFKRAIYVCKIEPDLIMLTSFINCLVSATPPLLHEAEFIVKRMEQSVGLFIVPFDTNQLDFKENYTFSDEFNEILRAGFWRSMKIQPDIMCYNLLIKGYTRTTPPNHEKARNLMLSCARNRLRPSIVTIATVVNAYCSVGLPQEAEQVFETMLKTDPSLKLNQNATLYNTLIKGYARCRCQIRSGKCSCIVCHCSNPDEAMRLVQKMEIQGLNPDEITLNTLIDSFCSAKRFQEGKLIIDSVMRSPNSIFQPSLNTYTIFVKAVLRFVVRSANISPAIFSIENQDTRLIGQILDQVVMDMTLQQIELDTVCRISVIKIYSLLGQFSKLPELVKKENQDINMILNVVVVSALDSFQKRKKAKEITNSNNIDANDFDVEAFEVQRLIAFCLRVNESSKCLTKHSCLLLMEEADTASLFQILEKYLFSFQLKNIDNTKGKMDELLDEFTFLDVGNHGKPHSGNMDVNSFLELDIENLDTCCALTQKNKHANGHHKKIEVLQVDEELTGALVGGYIRVGRADLARNCLLTYEQKFGCDAPDSIVGLVVSN